MDYLFAQRPVWEYGYGWLACGITVTLWLLSFWFNRQKARRVICREVEKVSMVRIQRQAGDRISVQFDRKKVSHLAQLEMAIEYDGKETLKDAVIMIEFDADTAILDSTAEPVPKNPEFKIGKTQPTSNVVRLEIPYLNPKRLYKHRIDLHCICDGDISQVRVIGSGEGWGAVYRNRATPEEVVATRAVLMLLAFILFMLWIIARWYVNDTYDILYHNKDSYRKAALEVQTFADRLTASADTTPAAWRALDEKRADLAERQARIDSWQRYVDSIYWIPNMIFLGIVGLVVFAFVFTKPVRYRYERLGSGRKRPRGTRQNGKDDQEDSASETAP